MQSCCVVHIGDEDGWDTGGREIPRNAGTDLEGNGVRWGTDWEAPPILSVDCDGDVLFPCCMAGKPACENATGNLDTITNMGVGVEGEKSYPQLCGEGTYVLP